MIAPDSPAPGVTGLLTPEGLDGSKLVRLMRDELGVSVQGGQDQMKGKLVRIGHMGYLGAFDMLIVVSALEIGLARLGYRFTTGAGVAAVQERHRAGVAEKDFMADNFRVLLSDSLAGQGIEVLKRYPRISFEVKAA